MSEDYVATVRIRRPARVNTDGGRNVWADTVEEVELELVSTTQLQTLLESDDGDTQGAIRQALSGHQEGVLARDRATGLFQVISEDDLKSILKDNNKGLPIRRRPADVTPEPAGEEKESQESQESQELSLVSTQMLRKIIVSDEKPARPATGVKPKAKDRSGGFDPYDSG